MAKCLAYCEEALARIAPLATSQARFTDLCVFAVLYFLAAKIGVGLTVMPEGIAILWPPNGVLLAFLLRYRDQGLAAFAAAALAAEVAADVPAFRVHEALTFGVINIAEAIAARALLRRWRFDTRFHTISDLLKFLAAAPVIAAFGAALCGGLAYLVFRGGGTGYVEFVRTWWFGDAVGLVIVTPLLLASWREPRPPEFPGGWRADGVALLGAVAALTLVSLAREGVLLGVHVGPILLLPFVLLAAARFGVAVSAAAAAVVALLILALTSAGRNPFGHASVPAAVVHAQEFIFVMSVMALGLAAILAQVRSTKTALELANGELRQTGDILRQRHAALEQSEREVEALNAGLERRVRERTRELEQALSQVRRLQGLLPMCAWCKRVRDDQDYWHSVEDYISTRTGAQFSHGICPSCAAGVESD